MNKGYLDDLFNLKDKVVLVTGATGQLGTEICKAYIEAGAKVVGVDKELNPEKTVRSEKAVYAEMDISNKETVIKTFEDIYSKFKEIDVLVNNAGVNIFEPFEQRTEESFDWVMDVNLKGTFFCIQTYIEHLRKNKQKGNIVNIASFYGVVSPDLRIYTDCNRRNSEVYGAVKAGIIQMTKYFAANLAREGIRVNCISPGGIFNPESPQGEDFIKNYSSRCPMERMADTEEIIGGLLYLSSDASTYTTGHNLVIDGGMSIW